MPKAGLGGHVTFMGKQGVVTWAVAWGTRADHASSAMAEAGTDGSHIVVVVVVIVVVVVVVVAV
jgi:hypothetical protein